MYTGVDAKTSFAFWRRRFAEFREQLARYAKWIRPAELESSCARPDGVHLGFLARSVQTMKSGRTYFAAEAQRTRY